MTTDHSESLRDAAELQKQRLFSLFMQAPTAIVLLRGPEYVIEVANPLVCQLWGRTYEAVINRPLFEALPEIRDPTSATRRRRRSIPWATARSTQSI